MECDLNPGSENNDQWMKLLIGIFLLVHIYLVPRVAASDLNWKIRGQTGYYKASNFSLFQQSDIMSGFEGVLKYKKKRNNHSFFMQLRFAPEFYGMQNGSSVVRLGGRAQYNQSFSKFHINLLLNSRKYLYNNNLNSNLTFDTFQLGGNLILKLQGQRFLSFRVEYFYRDLEYSTDNQLDAAVIAGSYHKSFSRFGRIMGGAYLERFRVDNPGFVGMSGRLSENEGWRLGPEFAMEYSRRLVVSLNYRFLWHQSDLVGNTSWEQWVRFLFGKMLSRRWSVFFLIDYYFRDFPSVSSDNSFLLYSPLENENRIYLNIAHDLKKNLSLFLKVGYLRDNLIFRSLSLSGLRATLGVEIKN